MKTIWVVRSTDGNSTPLRYTETKELADLWAEYFAYIGRYGVCQVGEVEITKATPPPCLGYDVVEWNPDANDVFSGAVSHHNDALDAANEARRLTRLHGARTFTIRATRIEA